ncbi:universal stress protein [Halogeometricum luteum]|uniref:Universal stress protein n=1 Tax=Halogeometricum luteum TaxID=2950537 RepID=A0ABU2G0C5_9EURY|nr:universal stress protein [Halogeometricum sp. S3BR5-2]MDS0293694.1 universal stress protein [Halogeometricum sp. S3BR5-2]
MVIVGAVDRSNRTTTVVREAERLAEAFDDTVHFVHALTRSEFVNLGRTSAQADDPLDMEQVRDAAAEMAEEAVTDVSVDYETVGLVGDPADEIIGYAEERDARYIVVRPRRRSPTGKVLFGSVAQSILLDATCPVVTSFVDDED